MTNGETMTGDQLAAQVFASQGYLVVSHDEEFPFGHVFRPKGHPRCGTPLVIVGNSSRAECEAQARLAATLFGNPVTVPSAHAHFYRAEAAD